MNQMRDDCLETAGPDAGGELTVALTEAARCIHGRMESALETAGLSAARYAALDQLARASAPLTLGELADRLGCVRSNVTQLVDRLEADGLVERRECPDDRRAIRAMITELGQARQAAGAQALKSLRSGLAGRLSDRERAELLRLLSLLH